METFFSGSRDEIGIPDIDHEDTSVSSKCVEKKRYASALLKKFPTNMIFYFDQKVCTVA